MPLLDLEEYLTGKIQFPRRKVIHHSSARLLGDLRAGTDEVGNDDLVIITDNLVPEAAGFSLDQEQDQLYIGFSTNVNRQPDELSLESRVGTQIEDLTGHVVDHLRDYGLHTRSLHSGVVSLQDDSGEWHPSEYHRVAKLLNSAISPLFESRSKVFGREIVQFKLNGITYIIIDNADTKVRTLVAEAAYRVEQPVNGAGRIYFGLALYLTTNQHIVREGQDITAISSVEGQTGRKVIAEDARKNLLRAIMPVLFDQQVYKSKLK